MVWLEEGIGDVKGILIDGYVPEFTYFKEFDPKALKNYLYFALAPYDYKYIYRKYLRPDREIPPEHLQLRVFSYLVKGVRGEFCPIRGERRIPSEHMFHPAQGYYRIGTVISHSKRELGGCLEPFSEEESHDSEKGRSRYGFNIVIYNAHPEKHCGLVKDCCRNWIDKLNFRMKTEDDYKNYEKFARAAQKFLHFTIKQPIGYGFI